MFECKALHVQRQLQPRSWVETPLANFGLYTAQSYRLLLTCWHWTTQSSVSHKSFNSTEMNPEAADKDTQFSKKNDTIADLTDNMSNVHVDGHDDTLKTNTMGQPTRRLVIYPRPHLLNLHKSPLVKPPDDMPVLKDWFGYVSAGFGTCSNWLQLAYYL